VTLTMHPSHAVERDGLSRAYSGMPECTACGACECHQPDAAAAECAASVKVNAMYAVEGDTNLVA
jgi:hypothetical protein